jgi:hypothetical protein
VQSDQREPDSVPSYSTRLTVNLARKWTFIFGLVAVLAILVGAGFANMSASDAPTTLETDVVRWIALVFGLLALGTYLIGRNARGREHTD